MSLDFRVFRYLVDPGLCEVQMPASAKVLSFGYQKSRQRFSLWALVNREDLYPIARKFLFVDTGHEFPKLDDGFELMFIGSVVMDDGFHVFHLFEIKKKEVIVHEVSKV